MIGAAGCGVSAARAEFGDQIATIAEAQSTASHGRDGIFASSSMSANEDDTNRSRMILRNSVFYSACVVSTVLLGGCGDHGGTAGGYGVIAACPGTSNPLPATAAGAPACGLVCRAELPITVTLGNTPLVDVWINDRPARLLLDTGASRSALLKGAAVRFGLGTPEARSGQVTGIGGPQSRAVVPVRSVAFGHVSLGPITADVISLGQSSGKDATDGSSAGPDAYDGIIGADVFGKYQLDLDLPHNVVRLYQGQLCPGSLPGWAHEDGTAPFVPWVHSGHTVVAATLDGAPTTAMLDSGASSTLVGLAAAHTTASTTRRWTPNQAFGWSASDRHWCRPECIASHLSQSGPK